MVRALPEALTSPGAIESMTPSADGYDLGMLERMPIGLAVYDADGGLVHSNPHFSRLVASPCLPSRDGGPGGRWQGFSEEGSLLAIADYPCERALRGENVRPGVDLLHLGAAGEDGRWLNVSAAPIVDPQGEKIVGVVLLLIETQDKRRASTFVVRASRRFRQFAESSATAIWIVDTATGAYSYRNPLHRELLGNNDGVVDLAHWLDNVAEFDRSSVLECYERAILGRTERIDYGLCDHRAGEFRRVQETIFPITDDNGDITMIGGMAVAVEEPASASLYLVGDAVVISAVARGKLGKRSTKIKMFSSLAQLLDLGGFLVSGCVIIDAATTPDFDSHLARVLARHARTLPIVIIGEAGTPATMAISAMRAGAADYLIPPVSEDVLDAALAQAAARLPKSEMRSAPSHLDRLARLSPRERDVLGGLLRGGTNKSIGRDLCISPRTVELHRSHLMERMEVRNLADLIRAAEGMGR